MYQGVILETRHFTYQNSLHKTFSGEKNYTRDF